jgi:hypothetical protein
MKSRIKKITLGIWLVGTIIVFVVMHQFELSSIASDPEAEQKFKGYGAFISGSYNVFRVGAVTVFGSAIIYWVVSFIAKTIVKITTKKTAEKMMR